MASRYSRIFLRPPKGTTLSSESWGESGSTADPRSTLSQGFSYPPSGSLPSHDTDSPMTSPPPHPYTLGATHSPMEVEFREPQRLQAPVHIPSASASEKRPGANAAAPQYPRMSRQMRRVSSIFMPPPTPLRLRPVLMLLLFLPVPPLLAMIYMVTGHAILRASRPSPQSIYRAPILSSLEAGATGGVILALPLALLLYLLLFPARSPDAPEDFFEDDTSSVANQGRWLRGTGYAVSVFFLFAIGGVSGPLGVTCLSSSLSAFVGEKKLLSTSAAAAAGFVGGVVLALAGAVAGTLATLTWVWRRRQQASPST